MIQKCRMAIFLEWKLSYISVETEKVWKMRLFYTYITKKNKYITVPNKKIKLRQTIVGWQLIYLRRKKQIWRGFTLNICRNASMKKIVRNSEWGKPTQQHKKTTIDKPYYKDPEYSSSEEDEIELVERENEQLLDKKRQGFPSLDKKKPMIDPKPTSGIQGKRIRHNLYDQSVSIYTKIYRNIPEKSPWINKNPSRKFHTFTA